MFPQLSESPVLNSSSPERQLSSQDMITWQHPVFPWRCSINEKKHYIERRKQAWREGHMIWFYGGSRFLAVSWSSKSAILTVDAAASWEPTPLWRASGSARFQRESRVLDQMPDAAQVNTLGGERGESAPKTNWQKNRFGKSREKRGSFCWSMCIFIVIFVNEPKPEVTVKSYECLTWG